MKLKAWQGFAGFLVMQLGGCPFLINTNICGDGNVDAFEECDDGNASNDDACLNTCEASFCGDGFLQQGFGEQCDDGNQFSGDGCDASCFNEGVGSCGDGFQDAGEGCDDGNNFDFDGCSAFCGVEQTGDVLFDYVLLVRDANNQIVAATSCNDPLLGTSVADIHFMLGNDGANTGVLDDNEIIQEAFLPCNQSDTNNDGIIDAGDLGAFIETFFAGSFDLFAVEFLNNAGAPIQWQTFDTTINAQRFSFGGGFNVIANTNNLIPFNADPLFLPQLAQELQAFFGF